AVVAEHVIVTGLDINWREAPRIPEFRIDVGLVEDLIVHVNLAAPNFHNVARHAYYPFDIRLRGIQPVPETEVFFPRNPLYTIYILVEEDPLLIDQLRQHAGAFHFYGLIQKNYNQDRRADGEEDIAGPTANFAYYIGQRSAFGLALRDMFNF